MPRLVGKEKSITQLSPQSVLDSNGLLLHVYDSPFVWGTSGTLGKL